MNYPARTQSKSTLLRKLKAGHVPSVPLPEVIDGDWITYDDRVTQITETIKFVGGSCKLVDSVEQINQDLNSFPEYQQAKQVWSNVNDLPGNIALNAVDYPHDLESVDFAIYQSDLAVAENGAVWVTDEYIRHRVVFFIAQHLVLIVHRSQIVDNLHQAYANLQLSRRGFNCWISGPSKTADIEQSLVIGAHGCRSMMMFIIAD